MTATLTNTANEVGSAKPPARKIGPAWLLFLGLWLYSLGAHWPPLWLRELLLVAPLGGAIRALSYSKALPGRPLTRMFALLIFGSAFVGAPAGQEAQFFSHFRNVWTPLGLAAAYGAGAYLCGCALLIRLQRTNPSARLGFSATAKGSTRVIASLVVMACLTGYAFALFTAADEQLDRAAPQVVRRQVLEKRNVADAGGFGHEVTLASWGWTSSDATAEVGPAVFARLSKGDEACIRLHPGYIGAAWYEVTACER
jgi:hypothetical protein